MLRVGDLVVSRSETDRDGENVLRRIEEVFVRRVQSLQILAVRSSTGEIQTIHTTQVHPVYINARGWVDAAHIHVGDQILEPTGGLSTVLDSRFENHRDGILVYNFRVAGTHTYFVREQGSTAEPVWVHNSYAEEGVAPKQGELFDDIDRQVGRYDRASQYPHDYEDGVRETVLARFTNEAGEVIDPLTGEPIEGEITLDHIKPVAEHWNEAGRFTSYDARKAWYNDISNLRPRARGPNSRAGALQEARFIQAVGPGYSN